MSMKALFQLLLWLYNVICQQLLHICLEKMGLQIQYLRYLELFYCNLQKTLKIEFYSSEKGFQSRTPPQSSPKGGSHIFDSFALSPLGSWRG